MFTISLYVVAATLLLLSAIFNKSRTLVALKKSWKSFENILPQFLAVILIIGLTLAALSPESISELIGKQSGWLGMLGAAIVGSVTLVPGFVAFPLAAKLMGSGGGMMQVTVFISTLMAVGVVTLPLEMQYFGRKIPLIRNVMAFFYCFVVSIVLGGVLS